jgi:hypothetical protein
LFNDPTANDPAAPTTIPYPPAVDSTRVTASQAADLANRIGLMLGYLTRLCDRMQQRACIGSDPLLVDSRAAQDAMRLCCRLHKLQRR